MKKKWIVIISGIVLLAIILCTVLLNKNDGPASGKAGTPAGDYDLGIAINCISKDYGMELWEEDATAKVTLTVEE